MWNKEADEALNACIENPNYNLSSQQSVEALAKRAEELVTRRGLDGVTGVIVHDALVGLDRDQAK